MPFILICGWVTFRPPFLFCCLKDGTCVLMDFVPFSAENSLGMKEDLTVWVVTEKGSFPANVWQVMTHDVKVSLCRFKRARANLWAKRCANFERRLLFYLFIYFLIFCPKFSEKERGTFRDLWRCPLLSTTSTSTTATHLTHLLHLLGKSDVESGGRGGEKNERRKTNQEP